jgi:hypothetical protein
VLFDGGATTSFVDESLVKLYSLSTRANPHEVRMANGSSVISPGTVYLHVTIQNYISAVTLRVLPLVPGFGVVLGDDWARSHQLRVNYGSSALQQALSLLLRSKRLCPSLSRLFQLPVDLRLRSVISSLRNKLSVHLPSKNQLCFSFPGVGFTSLRNSRKAYS